MRKLTHMSTGQHTTREGIEAVARTLKEARRAAVDLVGRGAGDNAGT